VQGHGRVKKEPPQCAKEKVEAKWWLPVMRLKNRARTQLLLPPLCLGARGVGIIAAGSGGGTGKWRVRRELNFFFYHAGGIFIQ